MAMRMLPDYASYECAFEFGVGEYCLSSSFIHSFIRRVRETTHTTNATRPASSCLPSMDGHFFRIDYSDGLMDSLIALLFFFFGYGAACLQCVPWLIAFTAPNSHVWSWKW